MQSLLTYAGLSVCARFHLHMNIGGRDGGVGAFKNDIYIFFLFHLDFNTTFIFILNFINITKVGKVLFAERSGVY